MARKSAPKSSASIPPTRRAPSRRVIRRQTTTVPFWKSPEFKVTYTSTKKKTNQQLLKIIQTTIIPEFFIVFGILVFSIALGHRYLYTRSLTVSKEQAQQIISRETTQAPKPIRVYIRWFLDTQVEPLAFTNGNWGISEKKATYLLQSARPGEKGNIIIYGHNRKEILGNIRALKGGEIIEVTTDDTIVHKYKVQDLHEVSPTSIKFLEQTESEILTLFTCSGPLDSLRFIVRAVPVE